MAEQYLHADPQTAVAKMRIFTEQMLIGIYRRLGFDPLRQGRNSSTFWKVPSSSPRTEGRMPQTRCHPNSWEQGMLTVTRFKPQDGPMVAP